ncbi:MAG TPA: tetratricopeptide repeat protein [bacterium]|nr:tetratricopeptide repeat protein [bacterium]
MTVSQRISEEELRATRINTQLAFAREFSRAGLYEQALEAFNRAIELDPAEARALAGKSLALTRLGRYGEALSAAEEIFLHEVNSPRAYAARGVCYQAMGFPYEAREAFEQSIFFGPDVAETNYDFARYWATRREPEKCRERLAYALALEPELAVVAATVDDLKPYRTRKWFLELVSASK